MTKQQIIDYVLETPHNTNPAILGQMIDEIGGGEQSWTTLTEENIRGMFLPGAAYPSSDLPYSDVITEDIIKVTLDNIEYECNRIVFEDASGYGGMGEADLDFTEYPFAIVFRGDDLPGTIYLETAGIHTIKIEVPQSGSGGGGSSDFSTANVTIDNLDLCSMTIAFAYDDAAGQGVKARSDSSWVGDYIVPLYKGLNVISCDRIGDNPMPTISVTGDATYDGGNFGGTIFVRGDCTITVTE